MNSCPVLQSKDVTARQLIKIAVEKIQNKNLAQMKLIWLEATGCSGNIISFLNAENPDIPFFLTELVSLTYNNSLMAAEGEVAFEQFMETLESEFILVVEGAVATAANGNYQIIARYHGQPITAMEGVKLAGEKAKYVLAIGTCASYGGPSAAQPNPSQSLSVPKFLDREVIRVPGCPVHPDWVMGTLAHLIAFGKPELDQEGRPIIFYGISIHDRCPRRSYFDQGIFANSLGDITCMFKLGCRGPITRTDCPIREWNGYVNWPIGVNTPCIGCAREGFPDGMEPFVRF